MLVDMENNVAEFYVILGGLLVADTIAVKFASNWNMGVLLPAILGMPLLIYGLFYEALEPLFSTGPGLWLRTAFAAGYLIFLALFIGCILIIRFSARSEGSGRIQAVIVLGAGLKQDQPSLLLQKRLNKALEVARKTGAVLVVSGGQAKDENVSEAEAMYRYLRQKGVPAERILREKRSVSTYENFLFSKRILDARFPEGCRTVFVTSDFHVFRARIAARHAGLHISGIRAPSAWYMALNFYLRETLAILRYFLFGVV